MNIKPGDVFQILSPKKRFGGVIYMFDYKGRMLFFDFITRDCYLMTYKTVERALNSKAHHPVHEDLKILNFLETIPNDVYEELKNIIKLQIRANEPEILDLF